MSDSQEAQPLVYRPIQARRILGIGQTKFYALIRSGDLRVKKIGRATLIESAELRRFVAELPAGGGQR